MGVGSEVPCAPRAQKSTLNIHQKASQSVSQSVSQSTLLIITAKIGVVCGWLHRGSSLVGPLPVRSWPPGPSISCRPYTSHCEEHVAIPVPCVCLVLTACNTLRCVFSPILTFTITTSARLPARRALVPQQRRLKARTVCVTQSLAGQVHAHVGRMRAVSAAAS
jgi:hypothetical protein